LANLVGDYLTAQRSTIKYCILDTFSTQKEPIYSPFDTLATGEFANPIDLELNTMGAQFSRAIGLKGYCMALAASDIVFIPLNFGTLSVHGPKVVFTWVSKALLSTYVLLGSPNIHLLIDGTMDTNLHKEAYLSWVPEIIAEFRAVIGDKVSQTKIIPINSNFKYQYNLTEKFYDWYNGPTLREALENSTKFRAPYNHSDILAPPMILPMTKKTRLILNLRGVRDQLTPLNANCRMVAPGEYGDSTQYPYREFFFR
jgi:hypothetical protein